MASNAKKMQPDTASADGNSVVAELTFEKRARQAKFLGNQALAEKFSIEAAKCRNARVKIQLETDSAEETSAVNDLPRGWSPE
jgi:hypothetical protein